MRHGQSIGNVNKSHYATIPDYALQLSPVGEKQAQDVGTNILSKITEELGTRFYISPYWRTRQTYLNIVRQFNHKNISFYEDVRLMEQNWGHLRNSNLTDKMEEYRDNYGSFYYRFDHGESVADVFVRVSDFMGTMFRDFEKDDFPGNVVIITHGMTMRAFLMRFFHMSVEEFEELKNPRNCEYYELELQSNDKYILTSPLRKHIVKHDFQFPMSDDDKKYFKYPHKLLYDNKS